MPLYSGAIVTALTQQLAQAEARAEKAEAALDRVRALCDVADRDAASPGDGAVLWTSEVRAAIEGES